MSDYFAYVIARERASELQTEARAERLAAQVRATRRRRLHPTPRAWAARLARAGRPRSRHTRSPRPA